MCGLIGVAGDTSGSRKKIFEDLLTVDVVRGPHSTGVGAAHRFKQLIEVAKSVGPPEELMSMKEYQELMKGQHKALIGHNRYATVGNVTDENAHPFIFSKIIGAHNGTLDSKCRARLHDSNLFETDSEAIFSHINEYGAEETFKLLANPSYSSNAWALTWYNFEDNTINVARNTKRPLYYLYSQDQSSMFWGSELGMLRWVVSRNNIKIHEDTVYAFTEGSHYKWEIPKSLCDKFTHPDITSIVVPQPIEPPPKVWTYNNDHHSNHHQHYGNNSSNILRYKPKDKKKLDRLEIDTKKWKPPYKDHNGVPISKIRLMEKITDGCTFCPPKVADNFKSNFKWGDFIFFLKPDPDGRPLFLCEECYNDEGIREVCEELL